MTQRINYVQQSPELFKKFLEFSNQLHESAIEESIRDLVTLRASQINGCGFAATPAIATWSEAFPDAQCELEVAHTREIEQALSGRAARPLASGHTRRRVAHLGANVSARALVENRVGVALVDSLTAESTGDRSTVQTRPVASDQPLHVYAVTERSRPPLKPGERLLQALCEAGR